MFISTPLHSTPYHKQCYFTSKHRVQPKDRPVPAGVADAAADHTPVEVVAHTPAADAVVDAAEDREVEAVAHNHEAAYSAVVGPSDHTDFGPDSGLAGEKSIGSGGRAGRWACRRKSDCSCSLEVAGVVADGVDTLAVEIAGVGVADRSSVDACKGMVWVACRSLE